MNRESRGRGRWFLKCRACRKPFAVELPRHVIREFGGMYLGEPRYTTREDYAAVSEASEIPCPLCGAAGDCRKGTSHGIMGLVQGRRLRQEDLSPVCDGRCTNARGPSCDCKCRGENHGSQRVVARTIDAGVIPA